MNEAENKLINAVTQYLSTLRKGLVNGEKPEDTNQVQGVLLEPPYIQPGLKPHLSNIVRRLNDVIKEQAYSEWWQSDTQWRLGHQIEAAQRVMPAIHSVAFLGKTGSHSHRCSVLLYKEARMVPVGSFAEACEMVLKGDVDAAVLPIDNSTAGTISEVYDLLLQHELYIVKGASLPIHNVLLGVEGSSVETVQEVWTHPQPIAQCSKIIKEMNWKPVPMDSTAVAVDAVARRNDKTIAAIGSRDAASIYGLNILLENIDDTDSNQTRFVTVMKTFVIPQDASRISLIFTVAHASGALSAVLSRLADFGLNVSKIQSRPIPHRTWEYSFHLDFDSRIENIEALKALYTLDHELPYLKLLGWYANDARLE